MKKEKYTLFVVDDEPTILELFEDVIKNISGCPFEIKTFSNPQEALEKVNNNIDLVITDVMMPELNGLELIKKIHSEYPEVLFAVITGYGKVQDAVKAINLGAVDYLTKPLRLNDIKRVLSKAANLKESRRCAVSLLKYLSLNLDFNIESTEEAMNNAINFIVCSLKQLIKDNEIIFSVSLILNELITNSIIHGNKSDPLKKIKIEFKIKDNTAYGKITDEGAGFIVNEEKISKCPEDLSAENGRGIFICKNLTSSFSANKNSVSFSIPLSK